VYDSGVLGRYLGCWADCASCRAWDGSWAGHWHTDWGGVSAALIVECGEVEDLEDSGGSHAVF